MGEPPSLKEIVDAIIEHFHNQRAKHGCYVPLVNQFSPKVTALISARPLTPSQLTRLLIIACDAMPPLHED
jgi:hypothetical protein